MAAASYLLLAYIVAVSLSICRGESIWGVNSPISTGLGPIPTKALQLALETAERDSHTIAARTTPLAIKYSIFRKRSAIRDLSESDKHLVNPNVLFQGTNFCPLAAHRACAILLLLRGHLDAAHDVILGVTSDNLEKAEYAATHRGQTNWTQEHPLTDSADLIHAALHRLEGSSIGEGDYKGYENAKYWLAGGPKALKVPAKHPVRTDLARIARKHAPCCVEKGVVAEKDGAEHDIIADGGKTRTVFVLSREWDGFVFVDLCEKRECGELSEEEANEITILQRAELVLLLRHELEQCMERQLHQKSTY